MLNNVKPIGEKLFDAQFFLAEIARCTVFWPKLQDAQVFAQKHEVESDWCGVWWRAGSGRRVRAATNNTLGAVLQCISMPEHNERYFKRILQKKNE